MKKDEIKIGEVYIAKISNVLSPVRILSVGNFNANGFNGLNLRTNKKVYIRSAQKLRYTQAEYNALLEKVKFRYKPLAVGDKVNFLEDGILVTGEIRAIENCIAAVMVDGAMDSVEVSRLRRIKISAPVPHASQT